MSKTIDTLSCCTIQNSNTVKLLYLPGSCTDPVFLTEVCQYVWVSVSVCVWVAGCSVLDSTRACQRSGKAALLRSCDVLSDHSVPLGDVLTSTLEGVSKLDQSLFDCTANILSTLQVFLICYLQVSDNSTIKQCGVSLFDILYNCVLFYGIQCPIHQRLGKDWLAKLFRVFTTTITPVTRWRQEVYRLLYSLPD